MNILVVAFRLHDATQQQVSRALHHLEKSTLSRDESARRRADDDQISAA